MKGKFLIPAIAILMVLGGCEFESYKDFGIKPYDGSLTFTQVTKKAAWKDRYGHAAAAFDGKLWILGGYNPGELKGDTYYEDVWSSSDGKEWELVTDKAPWNGRRGHSVVVHDDGNGEALYLIGGFTVDEETGYREYTNDVWRSRDGENWTQIKARTYPELESQDTLFPRMDHAAVVANHGGNEYIYIIGGRTQLEGHSGTYAQEYFNDVWRSQDGVSWERLNNNDFGRRAGHAAAVDPSTGTIYVQGGMHGIIFEAPENASHPSEDWMYLWSSPDGINWTASYDSIVDVSYTQRTEHEMVFFNNTLWVFPGSTISTMHYHFAEPYHYPTWRVDPGNLWSVDSKGSDLKGRHSYAIAVFDGKIWFFGGFTSFNGQNNDVWTAE